MLIWCSAAFFPQKAQLKKFSLYLLSLFSNPQTLLNTLSRIHDMYIFSSFPALNEKGELFKFVDITHRLLLYTADIHTQLASIHSLCRVASTAIFWLMLLIYYVNLPNARMEKSVGDMGEILNDVCGLKMNLNYKIAKSRFES